MNRPLSLAQDGYTFVEVFVAMMVFAFGILALYRLQIASVQNNVYANRVTEAANLAETKVRELMTASTACPTDASSCKACSSCDLDDRDGDGSAGLNDTTCASADCAETHDGYVVYVNVAEVPAAAGVNGPYRIIRVKVCFADPKKPNQNCAHQVSVDCIKAE